jgi:hypothetical protein
MHLMVALAAVALVVEHQVHTECHSQHLPIQVVVAAGVAK